MQTARRKCKATGTAQNETEAILDKVDSFILEKISLLESDSASSRFVDEMCDSVRQIHSDYPKIKELPDRYWNSSVSADVVVDQGMMAVLEEFLTSLEEIEKMRLLIETFEEGYKSLREIYRIIRSCSPPLQSYNISGLLLFAKLEKKDFQLYFEYWFMLYRVKFESLQSFNWLDRLRSRLFLFPFIVNYLAALVPGEDLYALITKALESAYLLKAILPKTHGLTTYDIKIYIDMKSDSEDLVMGDSEELVMGATFVIFLHEVTHWLSRINAPRLIDSLRVKSAGPDNSMSTGGGFDFEKYLFGDLLHGLTLPVQLIF